MVKTASSTPGKSQEKKDVRSKNEGTQIQREEYITGKTRSNRIEEKKGKEGKKKAQTTRTEGKEQKGEAE